MNDKKDTCCDFFYFITSDAIVNSCDLKKWYVILVTRCKIIYESCKNGQFSVSSDFCFFVCFAVLAAVFVKFILLFFLYLLPSTCFDFASLSIFALFCCFFACFSAVCWVYLYLKALLDVSEEPISIHLQHFFNSMSVHFHPIFKPIFSVSFVFVFLLFFCLCLEYMYIQIFFYFSWFLINRFWSLGCRMFLTTKNGYMVIFFAKEWLSCKIFERPSRTSSETRQRTGRAFNFATLALKINIRFRLKYRSSLLKQRKTKIFCSFSMCTSNLFQVVIALFHFCICFKPDKKPSKNPKVHYLLCHFGK